MSTWLIIFLLTFLPILLVVFGYFVYLMKKHQHKLYAKILSGGKWVKEDITDKKSENMFTPESDSLDEHQYVIETDKVATEGSVIQKKVIKYVEGMPQPIWHMSNQIRQLRAEEREILQNKLNNTEYTNEEGELTEDKTENPVNPLMFIDAPELYKIIRMHFSGILSTEEDEGWSLPDFSIWWIVGIVIFIVILFLFFNLENIVSLIKSGGAIKPSG